MPPIHTSHFTIREYECDAYGHLNQANYARLMQEAAIQASAAVGYDKARYEALGRVWLARQHTIEYLQPLFADDTLALKTWVADFRQVRSLRRYEFYRDETLVARAATDWVYLDRESGRPVTPLDELKVAYGDAIPKTLPREPFPTAPAAPAGVVSLHKRVEWRDIDSMQHVNNAAFLNMLEDAAIQAARHLGWPVPRLLSEKIAMMVRRQQIEYKQPALLDDELEIRTWLFDLRRIGATRYYEIRRISDDALMVRAQAQWVVVNIETGRPMRVPTQLLDDFAPNTAQS